MLKSVLETEEKIFQNWRALGITDMGEEILLCLGMSVAQIKKLCPNSWYNYLSVTSRKRVSEICIQKWIGISEKGKWVTKYHMDLLPVDIDNFEDEE